MKNMSMKVKMILGFVIPIVFTIINVVIGMLSVRSISNSVSDMQDDQVVAIQEKMKEIGADETKANMLISTIEEIKATDMESINSRATTSNLISLGLVVLSVIITIIIAVSLINTINKSVTQLSKAAKDIAIGRVDIEMVK